jgi:hypothetical protein
MNEAEPESIRSRRRVVLIGSMGVYHEISEISRQLMSFGINTVIPEEENDLVHQLPPSEFEQFKRRVSFSYLRKIRDPRTYCVLAVNLDRHGILNYIGPNTFAEIAVAFAQSKRIYLIQGIPDAYIDELSAWRTMPLRGDLSKLISEFRRDCMATDPQTRLF